MLLIMFRNMSIFWNFEATKSALLTFDVSDGTCTVGTDCPQLSLWVIVSGHLVFYMPH